MASPTIDDPKTPPSDRFAIASPTGGGFTGQNPECVTHQVFDAGDHRVYVGRVVKLRYDPDHEPLVYLQGRFRKRARRGIAAFITICGGEYLRDTVRTPDATDAQNKI
jgi:hypothetical protein